MGTQTFEMTTARIGKYKGHILKHAVAQEVLGRQGRQIPMPANHSDTYIARRFLPYGATSTNANTQNRFHADGTGDRAATVIQAHQVTEGITPTPDSLSTVDVQVVQQEYSCLYGFTDKMFNLFEDDFPKEMVKQVGERVTFVNEMIIWGALKACTNAYYGGTGTTLATVNGGLTLNLLRRIARNLMQNHARPVNEMLKPGPDYDTHGVEQGFVVYIHTDACPDIRDLPGFINVKEYATGKPLPHEIGACEDFRFIVDPDLPSFQDGGASVSGTGLYSTSGTSLDVYPFVVCGQDAWSQIAVRGVSALDPTYLPPSKKTKSDPHGQRGYAGTLWWKAVMIENAGWMAVGHVGVKSLT